MANVNFHLRDLTAKTPQRIAAIFFIENKMIKINTNRLLLPEFWSKSKKQALSSYDNALQFNKLLKEQKDFFEENIEKHLILLKRNKKRFHKDVFQEEIQNEFNEFFKIGEIKPKSEDSVTDFISFIDRYISDKKELAEGTAQTLRGC